MKGWGWLLLGGAVLWAMKRSAAAPAPDLGPVTTVPPTPWAYQPGFIPIGQPCTTDSPCGPGICINGRCASPSDWES